MAEFEDPVDRYRGWMPATIGDRAHMLPPGDGAATVEALQLLACAATEIAQLLEAGINMVGRIAEDHRPAPSDGVWKHVVEAVEEARANPEVIATRPGVHASLTRIPDTGGEHDRVDLSIDVKALG